MTLFNNPPGQVVHHLFNSPDMGIVRLGHEKYFHMKFCPGPTNDEALEAKQVQGELGGIGCASAKMALLLLSRGSDWAMKQPPGLSEE